LIKALIIDYGVGNLFSIEAYFKKFDNIDVSTSSKIKKIENFDIIILPGVGNFSEASRKIKNFENNLKEVTENGSILFGICLGMHLLFSKSEEGPGKGLKILNGEVVKLPSKLKLPHIGWNTIKIIKNHEIIQNIKNNSFFYFAHSYYPIPKDKDVIIAKTLYGKFFPSIIAYKNVYGTQFHPEKSNTNGLKILENLLKIVKR